MAQPRPKPPLDAWPVQAYDERIGFIWYCEGGVIVSQATVRHGTPEAADAYHDLVDQALEARADDLARSGGLFVVHDWRELTSYDAAARKVWQERMRRRGRGYLRGAAVVVAQANPLLRMAVQGANLMAALNLGSHIELATDMPTLLRAHGIEPPQEASFPGG
ncbi:MAG: hypothetical protein ACODAU_04670 [Myxococcota bacterium]